MSARQKKATTISLESPFPDGPARSASHQANGTFTLTPTILDQINGGPLADGEHTLHLRAADFRRCDGRGLTGTRPAMK
jgi:hypothetical protein